MAVTRKDWCDGHYFFAKKVKMVKIAVKRILGI